MTKIPLLRLLAMAVGLLAAPCVEPALAQTPAQNPASEHEGATALGLVLRQLGTTQRVLMIGAHPDDESTQLLSTLALGEGAEVAYLSLTRGEGGQNGIGPELGEGLGLLRTEELLAARRLDGAYQFFTRAYDFGFSKNADETFRHWPRDSLLADVVGVIRTFRPDIIISQFTGTPSDGHGQHQAAGIMAREGFEAAGDPSRFPEQIENGLRPHSPSYLFQNYYRPNDEADIRIATGEWDPLLGRSPYQVAMASRSRHRSQDMGRPLTPGPQWNTLTLVASHVPESGAGSEAAASGGGLFSGLDATLADRARHPGGTASDDGSSAGTGVVDLLSGYERTVSLVRDNAALLEPGEHVDGLAAALEALLQAESLLAGHDDSADLRFHLAAEKADVRDALARAAGLVLDAVADDEEIVPGQEFELELTMWNGGGRPVAIDSLAPSLPDGWSAEALDPLPSQVPPGELVTRRFRVRVPESAAPTEPYYLREPRTGDLYRWPAEPEIAGRPFQPAPVQASAAVRLDGTRIPLREEATYRGVDQRQGEFRRPVRVVPRASVLLSPEVGVVPLPVAAGERTPLTFTVRIAAEDPDGLDGTLRLELPEGWSAEPASLPLRFEGPGGERVVEFTVSPPARSRPGSYAVSAVFETADGERFARGYQLVDYPHTRPRPLYRPASATVEAFEVRLPPELRVGYVMGAGDEVPAALRQLGITPTLLDEAALARADLGRFDVIVTGIRAYEVRPDLIAHNRRLLEYVRDGGTLIVQYNKYEFPEGDFAPYPVTMERPHDRVTDETAPVRLLDPSHPVLAEPNRITAEDFEGWIQERGLYFLHSWDDAYTPLLEMADPGEEPLRGGLVIASHGEGTYVYTGLAFFRQLPAGVPGAYRLFANLLALGAK